MNAQQLEQLYSIVHEEIMQARIKIWRMKDQSYISISEIDNILSSLSKTAPQKAIDLFSTGLVNPINNELDKDDIDVEVCPECNNEGGTHGVHGWRKCSKGCETR